MDTNAALSSEQEFEDRKRLTADPRWQLVQRVVHSRTMRRAVHLQKMLVFITEVELLRPASVIREQDIAQKALGRSDDFDPAYDTIVRVQASHLRHKLQDYFATEGAEEQLRLTVPKGSYLPIFAPADAAAEGDSEDLSPLPEDATSPPLEDTLAIEDPVLGAPSRRRWYWIGLGALAICLVVTLALWKLRHTPPAGESSTAISLFSFMEQHGGKVAVVLPDTSFLLIQKVLGLDIPLETYTKTSYLEHFSDNYSQQAKDPHLLSALRLLGVVRTTTLDEAQVGMDFVQALNRASLHGELRYARDLHIRDLGEGNYILIGNRRSNPWVTLFTDKCNFRYMADPSVEYYSFQNVHPAPGESTQYVHSDSPKETTNFVDITLTPNLTDSGYVLLIIGSDVPANEAAARFLMGEDLPDFIKSRLRRKDLRSLEILLRGHHFHGESNDKLEIVAYRVTKR